MKKIYKIMSFILTVILLSSSTAVFAQDENLQIPPNTPISIPTQTPATMSTPTPSPTITPIPTPTATPTPTQSPKPIILAPTSKRVSIDFDTNGGFIIPSNAKFELYGADNSLLSTRTVQISNNTTTFTVNFDVPQYNFGDSFTLKLVEGLKSIRYYDEVITAGNTTVLQTYYYTQTDTGNIITNDTFKMSATPYLEKQVNVYINNNIVDFTPRARIVDNVVMVPLRQTANTMGINDVTYDDRYKSVRVAFGDSEILFNIGTTYTTLFGQDVYTQVATQIIDGSAYVPLAFLTEAYNGTLTVYDHDTYIDVLQSYSSDFYNQLYKLNYVKSQNLTSETNYLIWVSKENYEVNVFKKQNGAWTFLTTYKCAIGTDETPTCVGTYRYYEKVSIWKYPDFYVAPIMRFNGGYAIHSTLLRYDGTDFNKTVGKKLSHGCVRVQPNDINWLINNIPLYTTIHITNE